MINHAGLAFTAPELWQTRAGFMRNKIIIIGTGNMCSRIYMQLLFDDSNAFF